MTSEKEFSVSLKMSDVETNDELAEAKASLDAQIASLEDAIDAVDGAMDHQVNDVERETEPSEAEIMGLKQLRDAMSANP
jgi:uncharacterized protein YdcH (DUF465 family)